MLTKNRGEKKSMAWARASWPVPGLVLEVQVGPTMSVRAQIIKNYPNWVQNRPFGLKLGPEACQDRSGAFGMGLTHSKGPSPAKKVKKCAQAAPGLISANLSLLSTNEGLDELCLGGTCVGV